MNLNNKPKSLFSFYLPLSVGLSLLVIVLASLFIAKEVSASPPGCSPEKPYNCAMSRENFDELVDNWCGLAKPDKQDVCRLAFFGFVFTSPSDMQARTGFIIPYYCKINYVHKPALANGLTPEEEVANIPEFCYIAAKRNTRYYTAIKKIIEECGTVDEQDASCARRIQQQFLFETDSSWADKPGPISDSTSAKDAINVNNDGAKTDFMRRLATYIKWLSLGLGILAVFGLVISGIQYAAAQDNPQAVSGAKTRIYNIVIGIVIFAFMFGLLQWLIPGGIFSL